MNATHLHLAFNHAPVFGTFAGLALLAFAVWRGSKILETTAFTVFILSGLFAIGVYLTGEPTEHAVEELPGVSEPIIEKHEDAAVLALTSVIVLAVLSGIGAFWFRRAPKIPNWCAVGVLCFSVVTAGFMAWTANLGGQIRHPEIRSGNNLSQLNIHPQ